MPGWHLCDHLIPAEAINAWPASSTVPAAPGRRLIDLESVLDAGRLVPVGVRRAVRDLADSVRRDMQPGD
jgi:hypothetical protein